MKRILTSQALTTNARGELLTASSGAKRISSTRLANTVAVAAGATWDYGQFFDVSDADEWLFYIAMTQTNNLHFYLTPDGSIKTVNLTLAGGAGTLARPSPSQPAVNHRFAVAVWPRVENTSANPATLDLWVVKRGTFPA